MFLDGNYQVIIMLVAIFSICIILKAKLPKLIEGAIKIAIALTGMGFIIQIFTTVFTDAISGSNIASKFTILDVGWAPVATITWGSIYTLYFIAILCILNIIMLKKNKTNTLDVDIFNMWHLSLIGLVVMYYSNGNIILASVLVIIIGYLRLVNADVMKPTFNKLLNMPEQNPTTTAHILFMINPIVLFLDKIISRIFPFLDKYDFDAGKLNKKIGFFGSKFAIGIYIGIMLGVITGQEVYETAKIAFIFATCLELFSVVGSWFTSGVDPLAKGVTTLLNNKVKGRTFNIGIDWPFLASKVEMWAVANILAPIIFIIALIMPNNEVLPIGGLIALSIVPSLLVITRGKMIRMILIGTILVPLFLYSANVMSDFITVSNEMLSGVDLPSMITHSTLDAPIERLLAVGLGVAGTGNLKMVLIMIIAIVLYILAFCWYVKQMKKEDKKGGV